MRTVESVLKGHPDKICDQIADALLDEYLTNDSQSRVAIEIMGGGDTLALNGEVTSEYFLGTERRDEIIYKVLLECGSSPVTHLYDWIHTQSKEINKLSKTGAGDSGIMYGYATGETDNMMPEIINETQKRARKYFETYRGDGKVQLTFDNNRSGGNYREVSKIQGRDFQLGGFAADTGLTGRKTQVDTYCGLVQHGGGSFSGKDPTKIDRSGAYMARWLAKHIVKKFKLEDVTIGLAYEIGNPQPVMVSAPQGRLIKYIKKNFDLSPQGIIKQFNLQRPIYYLTASYGHFGYNYPWENDY